MNEAAEGLSLATFRRYVRDRLGLVFEGSLEETLEQVLFQRVAALGLSSRRDYLSRLEGGLLGQREEQELATLLTVGETHFFRHSQQLTAFSERVIPKLSAGWPETRPLRLLSAGCSTGEEPYSLAMILVSRWPALAARTEIVGIDLDPQALEHARRGEYSRRALRSTPASYLERFFEARGDRFVLDPQLRSMVRFEARNLVRDSPVLLASDRFDVIFCRNVIIYFRFALTRELVQRFSRALVGGGYLFLGHTESLRGISTDFAVEHNDGSFYYRRLPKTEAVRSSALPAAVRRTAVPRTTEAASMAAPPRRRGGLDRSLEPAPPSSTPSAAPSSEPSPTTTSTAVDHDRIFELLRLERFDEALPLARQLVREDSRDVDSLTLLAVLLTNRGESEPARAACMAILSRDHLHAGAHYLLALCAELEGAYEEAEAHGETAIHLDPGFSMAHLHLGRLALRANRPGEAGEHLERAERLIESTESAQLLLYGGGFRREALVALCRAQLASLAGSSS